MARIKKVIIDDIYQLKVTLSYSAPKIWRRILVHGSCSLGELHWVLQNVMGWDDSHLHSFRVGHYTYMSHEQNPDNVLEAKNELREILMNAAPKPRSKLLYVYGFGGSWGCIVEL